MTCELCSGPGGEILWQDASLRVVLADEPAYPGFCRVIWNPHVKEMTDLPPSARGRLMDAVYAVEDAVRRTLSPDKVNLACLGNMTPHLHWHVIPRFRADAHFPNAVWSAPVREARPPVSPAQLARLRQAVQEGCSASQEKEPC